MTKPKPVIKDWFEGRCGRCSGGGYVQTGRGGTWVVCSPCKGTGAVR